MRQTEPRRPQLVAFYGSPRRRGNTSRLLLRAVEGAREAGADVEELFLGELKLSPCREGNECRATGRCAIADDFQKIYDLLVDCDGILMASPLFFGTVSAQAKTLIDRCQSFWTEKYILRSKGGGCAEKRRLGVFISAAARKGRPDQFDGAVRTVRYFFDALDALLWKALLYPRLEEADDVLGHPDLLREAYDAGFQLVTQLRKDDPPTF